MKSLLAELRRRHVFRVAAWYAVAAWLVIQIAVNVFPHLLLPDWSIRLVVVLCLIGFPVAIALAWALEVTPEGVRVTEHDDSVTGVGAFAPTPSSASPWRGASLWLALAGGALLGVGAMQAWHTLGPVADEPDSVSKDMATSDTTPVPARVLAVLPFENLGGDEANAAFTAGIHDTLITRIAKIGGMTVISRTSVMAYEGARPNLKDVARALGVTHVVEGSVQRAGDRVQIQTQLIDAATDTHMWAETYDRTLAEGFATQNEIATAIARELSVRLSDRERVALDRVPTENPEAFEQYVLGHSALVRDDLPRAIRHFQAAATLDPQFALAIAELSIAHARQPWIDPAMTAEEYEREFAAARNAYERALVVQSNLAEGIFARGVFHYLSAHDFAAAEPDIINAVTGMPNNPLPHSYLGFIRRRQGRWTEAAEHLERAATIEPENMNTLVSLNHAYNALRQRESSERAIRRAAAADPDAAEPALLDALLILGYNGDLLGCIAALQRLRSLHPDDELIAYYLEFYFHTQGRFEDASKLLESGQGVLLGVPGLREMELGWALREAGHQTAANRWFEAALSQLDTKGTHWRRTDLAFNSNMRAYTLLGLGRTDEALAAFRSALSESPRTRDEVDWSTIAYYGFGLLGRSGDVPGALELVRQMLDPPSRFLPNQIWFHWAAAPLRTNPEFRELMARHGVDVTRDPRAEYAAQQASATGAQ